MKKKNTLLFITTFIILITLSPSISPNAATAVQSTKCGNLILFVQFEDSKMENFMGTDEDVSNVLKYYGDVNGTRWDNTFSKSLSKYVNNCSYGQMQVKNVMPQLSVSYDVADRNHENPLTKITAVKLPHNRSYYSEGDDYTLIKDSLSQVASQYSLTGYELDLNYDDYIDNVTVICEVEEDVTARLGTFYPHKSEHFGSGVTVNDLKGNKSLGNVNVINSKAILDAGINNYGVICHEFMHSLGYPDLYTESGNDLPVGTWDQMASSSNFLCYPLAYLRQEVSGWTSLDVITSADVDDKTHLKHLAFDPVPSPDGQEAYVIQSPLSSSEFFVIEYRKQGTRFSDEMDVKIPGTGLVVYRINKKAEQLSNHNGKLYGVYVYRPYDATGENSDSTAKIMDTTFFSPEAGRTAVGTTDLTKDYAQGALVFSDGTNSGIAINNIEKNGDTFSCDVTFSDYEKAEVWDNIGTPDFAAGRDDIMEAAVDVDSKGTAYMAYAGTTGAQVCKYDHGTKSWEKVGAAINNYGYNLTMKLYEDVPYVLENDSNDNLILYKLTNNQWSQIGKWDAIHVSGGFYQELQSGVQYASMVAGENGLYIGYGLYNKNQSNQYQVKLAVFTNANGLKKDIADVGTEYFSYLSMSADGDNVYISSRNCGENSLTQDKKGPFVYRINTITNKVEELDKIGVPSSGNPKIAVADGNIYVLTDDDSGVRVFLYNKEKYNEEKNDSGNDSGDDNGKMWQQVGDKAISTESGVTTDLAIMDGCPIVQLAHQSGSQDTQVYRYRSGSWVQEGNNIDTTMVNQSMMAVYDNYVYVAYMSPEGYASYPVLKRKQLQIYTEDVPNSGGSDENDTTEGTNDKGETGTTEDTNDKKENDATIDKNNTNTGSGTYKPSAEQDKLTSPARITGLSSKKRTNTSITIKWKELHGVTGYQVYRSLSKKKPFKKIKTITKENIYIYKNKHLKKHTKYYYKVRAYKRQNGVIIYGTFSKIKAIKTK